MLLIVATFHATGDKLPAVAINAINDNGADMIIPAHVHGQHLLRRVGNDEDEIMEERTGGFMDKLKSVAEKIKPSNAVEKFKEMVVTKPEWVKIVEFQAREAKRHGLK
ncbi:hypothetical protein GN244_ATG18121 [Phytophthora infestans]|uniref:Uncharacterized protein n=1 Tax=Phytophthora infestans TaxID=4787 RepID=A0A833WKE4_PHYIN|nr:hypothetical protein GN244_ATG18121 [Phytophthora infestans]